MSIAIPKIPEYVQGFALDAVRDALRKPTINGMATALHGRCDDFPHGMPFAYLRQPIFPGENSSHFTEEENELFFIIFLHFRSVKDNSKGGMTIYWKALGNAFGRNHENTLRSRYRELEKMVSNSDKNRLESKALADGEDTDRSLPSATSVGHSSVPSLVMGAGSNSTDSDDNNNNNNKGASVKEKKEASIQAPTRALSPVGNRRGSLHHSSPSRRTHVKTLTAKSPPVRNTHVNPSTPELSTNDITVKCLEDVIAKYSKDKNLLEKELDSARDSIRDKFVFLVEGGDGLEEAWSICKKQVACLCAGYRLLGNDSLHYTTPNVFREWLSEANLPKSRTRELDDFVKKITTAETTNIDEQVAALKGMDMKS